MKETKRSKPVEASGKYFLKTAHLSLGDAIPQIRVHTFRTMDELEACVSECADLSFERDGIAMMSSGTIRGDLLAVARAETRAAHEFLEWLRHTRTLCMEPADTWNPTRVILSSVVFLVIVGWLTWIIYTMIKVYAAAGGAF